MGSSYLGLSGWMRGQPGAVSVALQDKTGVWGRGLTYHVRAQSVEGEGEGHDPLVEWGLGMLGGQSEV